jgi:hypothetical protein
MRINRFKSSAAHGAALFLTLAFSIAATEAPQTNLVKNPSFTEHGASANLPADYQLDGGVEYRYLGDPVREVAGWGIALQSANSRGGATAGSVSQTITGIDSKAGRWFRFSFRGLPQDNFTVADDDLYMKVEFFGNEGRKFYDGKVRKIYPIIQEQRRDLSVNGDRHVGGAAVWHTYQLDFYLPFPQVDQLRLSVGFDHAASKSASNSEFFVTDMRLISIFDPALDLEKSTSNIAGKNSPGTRPNFTLRTGDQLLPIGGRWYYDAAPGESAFPKTITYANADRLLYHDTQYFAPFADNMTAWLRAGFKDANGNIVDKDQFLTDNEVIELGSTHLIIHTKGIPNHPTGKFPESGFGRNPSYIQVQNNTFYIPLNPQVNPRHFVTTTDNSNQALPMGPIGIAANGVVFFNPFDAGNMDASNMMDYCCGHPNPDNLYHYHKYPICMNSPWADEGSEHSPLIGWAFDGFPIYGPYESAGVMAKDVKGETALNDFNLHFDKDRGWHYHVTPGKFPYIIGGYWGSEDPQDRQRPNHPPGAGRGMGPGNGPGGRGGFRGPPPDGGGMPPFPPPPDGQ